ncbi:chaperonin 60 subunit beta 4, chloroplastic-like protein isoform X2 [Tanacetum coccineum]
MSMIPLLNSRIAIIKVEAQTQVELKDKQLRMEDAVNATKREEGVVVGGGCCLLRLSLKVNEIKKFMDYKEQKISKNGGVNGSVVIEKVFYKLVATSAKIDNSTYSVLLKVLLAVGNWRKVQLRVGVYTPLHFDMIFHYISVQQFETRS